MLSICSNLLVRMSLFSMFILIVFLHEVSPLSIVTEPLAKESDSSNSFMTALLALPLSGGAFTFILSALSSQPTRQSFDEVGMTLI